MNKGAAILLGGLGLYLITRRRTEAGGAPPLTLQPIETGGYNVVGGNNIAGEIVPQYYPPSTLTMFEDLGIEPPTIVKPTELIERLSIPLRPVIVPGGKWIE